MKLTEALNLLSESKKGTSQTITKSRKGRVKTYPSIKVALGQGSFGQIFSTTAANRLYVISKGKWGSKSGRGKIAKGFTPGSATPSADFKSIKKHAARTLLRYGKGSNKLAQKYGSRSIRKARGIFGKDGRKNKQD
tara:strand:- start:2201 stop:2608 length:408 start_codon:yes stop_codon:yes gene_type:complete